MCFEHRGKKDRGLTAILFALLAITLTSRGAMAKVPFKQPGNDEHFC